MRWCGTAIIRPLMPYTLTQENIENLPPDLGGASGENRWTLNFGPQHPATHTTLRLVLELDGERILRATPHIGYLHSGFEKLGEHLNYNQYVTIVDRMDYSAPIYNELAWHGAAEKLMGIELTPRCKVLRTHRGGAGADSVAPSLHRRGGAGSGGVHRVSLRLQSARDDL